MAEENISKVCILTGGNSPERKVSINTAESIQSALQEMGISYNTILAEGDYFTSLQNEKPDVVFIAMHGGNGENGVIQGLLESMGIPYTGSSVLASGLCMNKVYSKIIFEHCGLKTPKWETVRNIDEITLDLPIVIKPIDGGSTIATFIINDIKELSESFNLVYEEAKKSRENEDTSILVEEYIDGREITVGILDGDVLPILEIISVTEFYDFEAKYQKGKSEHKHIENIDAQLYKCIQEAALKAYNSIGCRGMGRVDFRLRENEYFILEINTIPGMTHTSLLPEAAEIAGINFNLLVLRILKSAKKKIPKI